MSEEIYFPKNFILPQNFIKFFKANKHKCVFDIVTALDDNFDRQTENTIPLFLNTFSNFWTYINLESIVRGIGNSLGYELPIKDPEIELYSYFLFYSKNLNAFSEDYIV